MPNQQKDSDSNSETKNQEWNGKKEQVKNNFSTIDPIAAVCILSLIGLVCVVIDFYLENN